MADYHITIEPIDIDDVIVSSKEKYNSNNHWLNNIAPEDYRQQIELNYTSNWIHLFQKNYTSYTINDVYHLNWMKRATIIGEQTGKFPNAYIDELNEFVEFFHTNYPNILDEQNTIPYFIRFEHVSLKYGMHGVGPYYNIQQVIESLVTCIHGHTPLHQDTNELIMYLLPFNYHINDSNEWRVFVYKNQITCISQQALYSTYPTNNFESTEEKHKRFLSYIEIIINYYEELIQNQITWSQSYSFDFAVLTISNQLVPYFIEFNCFGKEYPSGSALFHWIVDEQKLYNTTKQLYFRYTYKNIDQNNANHFLSNKIE
jgi:hypothetical protein